MRYLSTLVAVMVAAIFWMTLDRAVQAYELQVEYEVLLGNIAIGLCRTAPSEPAEQLGELQAGNGSVLRHAPRVVALHQNEVEL